MGNSTPLPGRETQHPTQNDSGSKDGGGARVVFSCLAISVCLSIFVLSHCRDPQGWGAGMDSGT